MTSAEKDYLYRVNRFKFNSGVEKLYVRIKKQRRYTEILRTLTTKYGYKTHQYPQLYTKFKLPPKSKKFFSRLGGMLLYRESLVGAYGELELFIKMERIKLAYFVLLEHVRVENFYMLNCSIFTLSDSFQKSGFIADEDCAVFHQQTLQPERVQYPNCHGGLNGRSLEMDWYQLRVYLSDFGTLRNYLG
jgi:hypothetical protein